MCWQETNRCVDPPSLPPPPPPPPPLPPDSLKDRLRKQKPDVCIDLSTGISTRILDGNTHNHLHINDTTLNNILIHLDKYMIISKIGCTTLHFLCYKHDFSYLHPTTMFKARGKTYILQIAKVFNITVKNIKIKGIK